MADSASDVPGRFDVVINGNGYVFADSIEPSVPFRLHRAIYDISQTFVQRQNVSNAYGDNAQDFFLTVRQRDWSEGEQQKYFRAGNDGRYWMGSNVDVTVPGQVSLAKAVPSLSVGATVVDGAREGSGGQNIVVASSSNLYRIDQVGNVTSLGAHGLGNNPINFGMTCDGSYTYLTTSKSGTVGVRKYTGGVFSTFSASSADYLLYLNNTLYGLRTVQNDLVQWDTAGTLTSLFAFKDATGAAGGPVLGKIESFGGKILILIQFGADIGGELWVYDGTGCVRLEVFPSNFYAHDVEVLYGVAYVSGSFFRPVGSSTVVTKPVVFFYDGSQLGKLWEANDYGTQTFSTSNHYNGAHPALGVLDGRLIFTDETNGNVMAYNPALGGVSCIGSVPTGGDNVRIVTSGTHAVLLRDSSTAYYVPSTSTASSGYVTSSLIDFDSSLKKTFRGVTAVFDSASDGDGGSVDIAYQVDSLSGSWTTLKTGATSGTEYTFPNGTAGQAVAIKITLNKSTSTAGPVLKSMSVRAAPQLRQFRSGEYIIDCTGTTDNPRRLRDGSEHPLTGYDQAANLMTAAKSTTPFTVTDRLGTFTAIVDLNDQEGFDIYEMHPNGENPAKSGSYLVRIKVREV